MSKFTPITIVLALIMGVAFMAYFTSSDDEQVNTNAQNWQITLFGEDEQPVNIFDLADPRIRIVYFGFTRCPDVCPTSLAMLSAALREVDDSVKMQFRPIFISIDPERDDSKTAATYAHYFHPMIEGLSAPLDKTTLLAQHYEVVFRKAELPNSALGYTIDHSSYFYFLKPDGTLLEKVPHTNSPEPIVVAINTTAENR